MELEDQQMVQQQKLYFISIKNLKMNKKELKEELIKIKSEGKTKEFMTLISNNKSLFINLDQKDMTEIMSTKSIAGGGIKHPVPPPIPPDPDPDTEK